MDPFPLGPVPVPPEVTRVEGCSCGGLTMHEQQRCSIFSLSAADQVAAVDAAQARLRDYTAGLNARSALHTPVSYNPDTAVTRGVGDSAFGADPDAGGMALIIRECCQRFRPDLVGPQDGATFTVTSGMTGRRYRVTVTEDAGA